MKFEYSYKCKICQNSPLIFSRSIGICPECIKKYPETSIELSYETQKSYRSRWQLIPAIPKNGEGVLCNICSNNCMIPREEYGYCGLWRNVDGHLKSSLNKREALLHTYYDPLPCNCCNSFFCPGGTSSGYPDYSYRKGAEYGYYNLACFLYGCNFSCLGCQNDQHKNIKTAEKYTTTKFLEKIQKNSLVSCICWFGGSPEPQLPWVIRVSRNALKQIHNRILRICFEWNGAGNSKLVQNATSIALESGGNVKFDLKYHSPVLSEVISGVSNKKSFENFKQCFDRFYDKREKIEVNPLLSATTLMIPGYVDRFEVEEIAQFLSSMDESIPYSLLIFHPDSYLFDLPITPKKQALDSYNMAKKHLKNVHLGNKHLLGI